MLKYHAHSRGRARYAAILLAAATVLALIAAGVPDARAQTIPNDPEFSAQWALQKIAAPQAWDVTQGNGTVKVAVVSTGVASTPADLQGQIGPGYNALYPGGGTQDDFGTYGDGTATAGIIGAATNNGADMAGVAWRVTLLPVKVCDLTGTCPTAAIAGGINWAVSNGAQIINVGVALNPSSESPDVDAAVANAVSHGVLVVGSAGNYSGYVGYPANLSGVIAVGATDSADNVASFSGRGPQLALVAPGVSVRSLARQGCCIAFSSAEFAAAHVSGALALLLSVGIPAAEAPTMLLRGSVDLGAPGWDASSGSGRLNICGALAAGGVACGASTPMYGVIWGTDTAPSSMLSGSKYVTTISFTNTGSLTWSATGANAVHLSYHWRSGSCPGTSSAVWDGTRTSLPTDVSSGGAVSSLAATVVAPVGVGVYCLAYDLVREDVTWFSSQGAATRTKTVTVTKPAYGVSWGPHTTPSAMSVGAAYSPRVTFSNAGSLTWVGTGTNAVHLSYHWRNGACPGAASAVWDGLRTALPSDAVSGTTVTALSARVAAPTIPGTYCLVYDLVREGVTWFSTQGAAVLRTTVVIN